MPNGKVSIHLKTMEIVKCYPVIRAGTTAKLEYGIIEGCKMIKSATLIDVFLAEAMVTKK